MREILFRGKSIDSGEWVYGVPVIAKDNIADKDITVLVDNPNEIVPREGLPLFEQIDPETVGQYTGLKGRNGERIFESDILCIKKRNGTKSRICFVCFGEYIDADSAFYNYRCIGFYIKIFDTCCTIGVLWDSEFEYEIIGNIHDNPELLKGEDNG